MHCPQCHQNLSADARFCPECGAKAEIVCSQCGTSNGPAHKFCKECGQRLAASGEVRAAPAQLAEPEAPKYLAEKIRTLAALENERKQVTVLFADIKSSTELIAERDPEDAGKMLDAVLQLMIESVHRFEGTVSRVMGDGIMALFGAPAALENHPLRGCYAALLMQETVKRYAEEVRRTQGLSIEIRIGINSGEVIVRSIRSDLQMDYTAVGQTTHLAARMEQAAAPGSILVTGSVVDLTKGYIDVKPLGPMSVKGLHAPIQVFEVIGAGPVQSRLQAAAARGLTRFVGRATEMDALRDALERAHAGHGQIAAVVGDAGVGKSRLLYELLHSSSVRGWLVLESSSLFNRRDVPYAPTIDLLKNYFKIDAHDDVRTIHDKVAGKLLTFDQSLQEAIPPILFLLDALPKGHPFSALEPLQRREQTVQAVKRIVLSESRLRPVIVVVEDLQWNDSATLGVIEGLIEGLRDNRILLVVSYRAGHQDDWGQLPNYRQLRLDPLPRAGAEELLHALLGADASLAALKELLIGRAEGNPFFIEEIVRTLIETGVLAGQRGRFVLAKSVSAVQVPPMVQDVIAARIDRLPAPEKRLIHEASVIGKDVPFALLHMISDLSESELRDHLASLRTAEFIYETRLFPDVEYTFKHALTHQVAYAGLLHDRRREIHARIVNSIEQLYSGRLSEHVERLGHHASQGEVWPKALTYLRQAGAKAVERPANREAVALFKQALEVIQHLPQDRATLEQAIDLRFDVRNALQPLGDLGQILEHLREAEQLATRIGDQHRLGWIASYLTEHYRMHGNPAAAAQSGERALSIARELADLPLRVVTNLPLGLLYYGEGRYRRAMEFLQWNIDQLQGDLFHEHFGLFGLPSIHSRSFLAWCLAEVGELARGRTIGEEAVRFAEGARQRFSMMYAYLGIGTIHLRSGELQQAIPTFERALELGELARIPVGFSYGASYLGYALALAGRVKEGLPLLEQSCSPAVSKEFVARHSLRIAYLGEGYLLSGRLDDAIAAAQNALDLARSHDERGHEAYALRLLGEVMTRRQECTRAREHYEDALRLAQALGMRPLAAHCHWGLARLCRHADDEESARHHAAIAQSEFRDMDMTGWLQRLDAEMASTTVPLQFYGNLT
jgi:class 3 adenylate cyclase/tetratricopeptide (TPR) repeat protein